jgi:hypothetical protein
MLDALPDDTSAVHGNEALPLVEAAVSGDRQQGIPLNDVAVGRGWSDKQTV